jgi:hypothetical protein
VDEQAELLPYDRKWEIPKEKIKLGTNSAKILNFCNFQFKNLQASNLVLVLLAW